MKKTECITKKDVNNFFGVIGLIIFGVFSFIGILTSVDWAMQPSKTDRQLEQLQDDVHDLKVGRDMQEQWDGSTVYFSGDEKIRNYPAVHCFRNGVEHGC
jgi:hypothetical protein